MPESGNTTVVGLWLIEHCPHHQESPYRLTITRQPPTPETLVLRVTGRWPTGEQHVSLSPILVSVFWRPGAHFGVAFLRGL